MLEVYYEHECNAYGCLNKRSTQNGSSASAIQWQGRRRLGQGQSPVGHVPHYFKLRRDIGADSLGPKLHGLERPCLRFTPLPEIREI
jgi:hypothetical protein